MQCKTLSTLAVLTGLFIFISPVRAQVELAWAVTYDGESVQPDGCDSDGVSAMAVDKLGRVHVTGESYGSNCNPTIVTIQYSPTGQPLWIATYDGGRGSEHPNAMALDDAGNVYVTGYSDGARSGADLIALKYDSNGHLLWAARYNGPANSSDVGNAIRVDPAGNVYVTGYSYNFVGNFDIVTIKYDAQGAELWVARYDGPAHREDRGQDLVVDASGNVYVTGFVAAECFIEPDYDEVCQLDGITIKYSPSGEELWVDRFDGGEHLYDLFNAITLDPAGHPIVTGFADGLSTIVTIKYGPDGQRLWVAREPDGGPILGGGWKIATDANGNVLVLGIGMRLLKYTPQGRLLWSVSSSGLSAGLAVDPAGNAYVAGTVVLGNTNISAEAVVAKYDPCGNNLWSFMYQASPGSFDVSYALALDTAGNVYAGGQTRTNLFAPGTDYFTLKLTQADAPLPPIVTIRATRAVTAEGHRKLSKPALFTVTREGQTNDSLTVRYAISGTASNGVDYTTLPDSILIPAGRHSAVIPVRPIDDPRPERVETVRLDLLPDPTYRFCTHRHAIVLILDNDRWRIADPRKPLGD